MKNRIVNNISLYLFLMFSALTYAQSNFNILNAKQVKEIGVKSEDRIRLDQDVPVPYEYVDERDILWSKIVWEVIDLNQLQNFRLYFPTDENSNKNPATRSLFTVLLDNVVSGKIKDIYDDSQFINKLTSKEVEKKLVRVDTASYGFDLLNQNKKANIEEYIDRNYIKSANIQAYQIKGMWYFNKRSGQLNYRLLAIAPMAPDVQTIGRDDIQDDAIYPLFWVFYPQVREILHRAFPFKDGFSNVNESFDYLLNVRDFNSTIIREENMYGNRSIDEYIKGNSLFQLRESDRIKESIRDLESDMWNY